jgi:polyphosphate kinase
MMEHQRNNQMPWIERDVSWMYFNHRILQEAQRDNVPILERMLFLGIYSNNLDEFFRVRIATLGRITETEDKSFRYEAARSARTLKKINKLNEDYSKEYVRAVADVKKVLEDKGILILDDHQINEAQQKAISDLYVTKLSGSIQPVWLKNLDQLDSETDDSIYLAVMMKLQKNGSGMVKNDYAVVKIPSLESGRFVRLPDADGKICLMYLDDVVRYCMPWLFSGTPCSDFQAFAFKFTKDAEMELDNDFDISKMQKVQKGVKSRNSGEPLRIGYDNAMPKELLKRVVRKLKVGKMDSILPGDRYPNHKDFMSFPDCGRKDLKYPVWPPLIHPDFSGKASVLQLIHERDRFLHVPYHSFDGYLRFLREAALQPSVKGIKITLYRLAKHSKVVDTLIAAAKNGKKVTVVIELLARFDEANNIFWSKKMKDAGIEVVFGVEGLKVHSKITLIEMTGGNIACIGTGNFHEGNARVYTDCMLFTAYKPIVKDIENVFSFIRTPFKPTKYNELLVSPNSMRKQLMELIDTEMKNQRMGRQAFIKMKINSVTDLNMVRKLYQAAASGVSVDMVLRGNCSIKIDDKTAANMHIHGIIDRYLEHSRILIFCNNGENRYFMGSADWMSRNLDNRIEVMTPVYNPEIQQELLRIVNAGLRDTMQGRIVDGSGNNDFYAPAEGEKPYRSQEALYQYYKGEIKKHVERENVL